MKKIEIIFDKNTKEILIGRVKYGILVCIEFKISHMIGNFVIKNDILSKEEYSEVTNSLRTFFNLLQDEPFIYV